MTTGRAKLERYRLLGPLGRGGQGRTFRALDTSTGRHVAIKVIELRGAGGWKPFDLFERECAVLRSLDHAGIPKYVDTFSDEEAGKYCLVMELVEGRSLKELMGEQRSLSEPQLWSILHQALEILEYLHRRLPPVIHRDLKPANLIQRPDGRLALVDFGGVRVALRPEGGSTVVGTFGYMAPEQLHGDARPATDLYSLGATMASLATGIEADKLPRKGLKVDLEPVLAASPLRELLSRLLEPEPEHRPSSVAEVRTVLRAAASTGERGPTRRAADRAGERGAADRAGEREAAVTEGPDTDSPLDGVGRPLSILVRVLGLLGYVGMTVLDAVFLPLIFAILGSAWSSRPDRRAQLADKRRAIRAALKSGRSSMRALARGRNPYHPLPPGPGPRQLPPRPGHDRHGRGRRGR